MVPFFIYRYFFFWVGTRKHPPPWPPHGAHAGWRSRVFGARCGPSTRALGRATLWAPQTPFATPAGGHTLPQWSTGSGGCFGGKSWFATAPPRARRAVPRAGHPQTLASAPTGVAPSPSVGCFWGKSWYLFLVVFCRGLRKHPHPLGPLPEPTPRGVRGCSAHAMAPPRARGAAPRAEHPRTPAGAPTRGHALPGVWCFGGKSWYPFLYIDICFFG